jgi:peptidyl-prolyl cis-trans isomerase D
MTGTMRSSARNPLGLALMGGLVLVFMILGAGGGSRLPDLFRASKPGSIVTAGAHSVSAQDFRHDFARQKQGLEQRAKQPLTAEFLVSRGVDIEILNQIAEQQALAEFLSRIGVTPAASLVDAQIQQIPDAFDKLTGKFSQTQFERWLAANDMTPQTAQTLLTDELAKRHFLTAVAANFRAPRVFAAVSAIQGIQARDVSLFVLEQQAVVQPLPPTDAQLTAFMKAHAAQLMRGETRVLTLVRFSSAALAPSVTVTDAEIQKEFAARKDGLSTPETRYVIQIPVRTAAEGAQAAQRLGRGENPAAIAHSFGVEPVIYVDKPRTAIADAKLAAIAFSLPAGQTAGPVQGDLGVAALKVMRVTPGHQATLATARPTIEAYLRQRAAQTKADDQANAYDQARQAGASVEDAARKAGVEPIEVGPVTADGVGIDGRPNPLVNDKVLKAAFQAKIGEDSDIQSAGTGENFVVKVNRILPPALPSLDEIRAPLTQAFMRDQLLTTMRTKADALMADIRAGKSMDAVAATVGGHVEHQNGLQLLKAQQYQALGRDLLLKIFDGKPGEVFDAPGQTGFYIARLDAVHQGDPTQTAQLVEALQPRVSQSVAEEMLGETLVAAKNEIKVSENRELADRAIGVDLTKVTGATAKGPGAAK